MIVEKVRWTDNMGAVGWTSLTAWLDADGMRWLLNCVPESVRHCTGFRPCFYWHNEPITNNREEMIDAYAAQYSDTARGFYFDFPDDERAAPLIFMLKARGFKMERGY